MRPRSLRVLDLHPSDADFEREVVAGLSKRQKELPCKYFYDAEGAALFEQICTTEEYYVTRTELRIFSDHVAEIAALCGPQAVVVEPGSGSGQKTRMLLEALDRPAAYVPVDISRDQLLVAAASLAATFPELEVLPVCADYTQPFPLPSPTRTGGKRVLFYPGSTIGNFDRVAAEAFLRRMAEQVGPGGVVVLGVDMAKDPLLLHAAYNDAAGITARFNKNVLARIARSLSTDVDLDAFRHYAFYDPIEGRIEMHLISLREQVVRVGERRFGFATGESIWTESSYKYTRPGVRAMAARAGLETRAELSDENGWFLVSVLAVPD